MSKLIYDKIQVKSLFFLTLIFMFAVKSFAAEPPEVTENKKHLDRMVVMLSQLPEGSKKRAKVEREIERVRALIFEQTNGITNGAQATGPKPTMATKKEKRPGPLNPTRVTFFTDFGGTPMRVFTVVPFIYDDGSIPTNIFSTNGHKSDIPKGKYFEYEYIASDLVNKVVWAKEPFGGYRGGHLVGKYSDGSAEFLPFFYSTTRPLEPNTYLQEVSSNLVGKSVLIQRGNRMVLETVEGVLQDGSVYTEKKVIPDIVSKNLIRFEKVGDALVNTQVLLPTERRVVKVEKVFDGDWIVANGVVIQSGYYVAEVSNHNYGNKVLVKDSLKGKTFHFEKVHRYFSNGTIETATGGFLTENYFKQISNSPLMGKIILRKANRSTPAALLAVAAVYENEAIETLTDSEKPLLRSEYALEVQSSVVGTYIQISSGWFSTAQKELIQAVFEDGTAVTDKGEMIKTSTEQNRGLRANCSNLLKNVKDFFY